MRDHMIQYFVDAYAQQNITLDDFQLEAITALANESDVLVSAPTGSGKTVIAYFAVELALSRMMRCVYTAPIKALSNQKYLELSKMYGQDNVGLLTGDQSIHREAPILVVTTEVLRNMLFHRDTTMNDVGYIILDEVHYLGDEARGPVWEETILQLPDHVRLVSLSATIANVDEFCAWLESVRGRTAAIVSTTRPVPLVQYAFTGNVIIPLCNSSGVLSEHVEEYLRRLEVGGDRYSMHGASQQHSDMRMRRLIIRRMQERHMLPAIHFIFSRKGCDRAIENLLDSGLVLTNSDEQAQIEQQLALLRSSLSDSDARTIKFNFWRRALRHGFAAHHAGIFPPLKELIEALTSQGLLKLIYATGTLALGIDMPVRTVILDELNRWNGSDFIPLSGTEYTQLVGRAGRRGKDVSGNAIVMLNAGIDAPHLERLAQGEVEPLNSVFAPSYNTVVHLLSYYTMPQAREIMSTSFAQFQRNADVGVLSAKVTRLERRILREEKELSGVCSHGDVVEYVRLREHAGRASKSERKRAKAEYKEQIEKTWKDAQIGHAYAYARDGSLEYGVLIQAGKQKIRFVTIDSELTWLRREELSSQLRDFGPIELPFGISPKDIRVRDTISDRCLDRVAGRVDLGLDVDLTQSWDRFVAGENHEMAEHPVHTCPHVREHLAQARDLIILDNRRQEFIDERRRFTDAVAHEYERTAEVLRRLGYIQFIDDEHARISAGGILLRDIHNECDALITLTINEPAVAQLSPDEFAGFCSAFLGDHRIKSGVPHSRKLRRAWDTLWKNYEYLHSLEHKMGIVRTPEPCGGAIDAFTLWAQGNPLDPVLTSTRMEVGDFITANRRLIDLMNQLIAAAAHTPIAALAEEAKSHLNRWTWM